jgi:hypothetical protein
MDSGIDLSVPSDPMKAGLERLIQDRRHLPAGDIEDPSGHRTRLGQRQRTGWSFAPSGKASDWQDPDRRRESPAATDRRIGRRNVGHDAIDHEVVEARLGDRACPRIARRESESA